MRAAHGEPAPSTGGERRTEDGRLRGWEQRGTNCYYYRKEREGGRVKSTYVGRGDVAHIEATVDRAFSLFLAPRPAIYVLQRLPLFVYDAERNRRISCISRSPCSVSKIN